MISRYRELKRYQYIQHRYYLYSYHMERQTTEIMHQDPLYGPYQARDLPKFISAFQRIWNNDRVVIDWNRYSDYLLEALKVCPPSTDVARSMLYDHMGFPWSPLHEELIKILIWYADRFDDHYLGADGYYHLFPDTELPGYTQDHLSRALRFNNVEEVKYLLKHSTDISEISLYNAIIDPIDNRESLALIMPYIHTCRSRVNALIVSAYVNNKLPEIPQDIADSNPIKIITAHFNKTFPEDIVVDDDVFYLSAKFGFSDELFFHCMKVLGDKHYTITTKHSEQIRYKFLMCLDALEGEFTPTDCVCSMCNYLRNL